MFIVVSHQNPEPMYKQVTDQIKDAIVSGALKPNDKLPSIRSISLELNISIITIKRAYTDLEKEGYIYTRSGLGSFVADLNREKMRSEKLEEFRRELKNIVLKAKKFNIPAEDILKIIHEIQEETNGK
ncbi:MAG: GntR family transcriptional regulator [Candidatus Aminicenantes bacterium]|nr:GntR family transcriptional regulator [Candidatus Aminicenantes bacterium]